MLSYRRDGYPNTTNKITNNMRTIRNNAEQLLRENYKACDWKDEVTFREYVENEMDNDPGSWNWLFNESDADLSYSDLTDKEKQEYADFLDSLKDDYEK